MAPRKVRAVASLIRGMSVNEAQAQLMNFRRRPTGVLEKLLHSAIAGATATKKLNPEKAFIQMITVDGGPMLKRSLPRARGSASPIQKKTSHITLVLGEREGKNRFMMEKKKKQKKDRVMPERPMKNDTPDKKGPESERDEKGRAKEPSFFRKVFNRKAV
jgi:large subunit ribosomal protein L22